MAMEEFGENGWFPKFGSLNMDYTLNAAAQQNEEGRKLREFADVIWKSAGLGLDNLRPSTEFVDKERPFLSSMTWALFSAYRQVLNFPAVQVMVMRTGADKKILADPEKLLEVVRTALPHYSDYIDEFGTSGLSLLIEDLEEKLLAEIVASLESTASDENTVTQAAAILKAVQKVAASTKPEVDPPAFPTE